MEADGRAVRFVDAHGVAALTYAGLTVRDADGRNVPARFEPVLGRASVPASPNIPGDQGSRGRSPSHLLRLAIDERGARYPLTIDPIAQQAYLKASNTGAGD